MLKTQLPYRLPTPRSAAPILAAAMVAAASGMVVTRDTARMPRVLEGYAGDGSHPVHAVGQKKTGGHYSQGN